MQSMKVVRWTRFTCLLLLATFWQTDALRADDKILSDRRLPKDTFLHISIGNVPEFTKQFNKTAGGKLFQDKALGDFWKEIQSKISDKQKEVEKAIGTELADLPGLAQGEVSLALCKAGPHGFAVVGFFHYGDKQELVNKLIEKAEKALAEEDIKRTEQEVSEVKVIVLKSAADDANHPTDHPFKSFCYFQKDNTLVFASDIDAIKQVLSRWDGQHEATLAKNDIYKYVSEHSRDDQQTDTPALTWYIDPVGGFTSVVTAPKATPEMGMAMMFLPMVGANKIRAWGGRMEFPAGEIDTVMRSILYMDQPASGVTNLLQFDTDTQAPPKWVRSDVSSYAAFNWDLQKAIAGIESLVDLKGPGTMAQLLEGLAQQGPKVHLRKDLLDHVSGHLHMLTKAGEGTGVKAAQARVVIALELKDAAAVKRTITKVMATAPPNIKSRDFQGETLYELPMPGGQFGGGKGDDAGGPTSAGMVIAEGQLMFSNDVTLLEQVLRSKSDQEQLADSAIYKRISKRFPAKSTSITFARSDEQIRAGYEMLRSGALTKGSPDAPDFSKLPEFSVLQKYFAPSGGYTIPDEHGLKSVTFSLSASGTE